MKKLLCIVALAAAALSAPAQLLWKVSGGNAKDTSYLFGTHHVAPVTLLDSIKVICTVDAVVGEIDRKSVV